MRKKVMKTRSYCKPIHMYGVYCTENRNGMKRIIMPLPSENGESRESENRVQNKLSSISLLFFFLILTECLYFSHILLLLFSIGNVYELNSWMSSASSTLCIMFSICRIWVVVTQAYYKLSFLLFTWNEQSYYCRR